MIDCDNAPLAMGNVNKNADRTLSRKFLGIAFVLILVEITILNS